MTFIPETSSIRCRGRTDNFGPEKLFGRDVLDGSGEDKDGYDMIREIPAEDEFLYRPRNKKEVPTFVPTMTDEMSSAISWFLLATAARWHREGPVDSSMLIHTSFQIEVHDSYKPVIEGELDQIHEGLTTSDEGILENFGLNGNRRHLGSAVKIGIGSPKLLRRSSFIFQMS